MKPDHRESRDVILNFRFNFSEAVKREQYMRRHGYTSRSQLLRDALMKKEFTTYITAPPSDVESLTELFDALETIRIQVFKSLSNTLQIIGRFSYFAFLDDLLDGVFLYDIRGRVLQMEGILKAATSLVDGLFALYDEAGNLFLDERIMKKEDEMKDEKTTPLALRREYLAAGTTVSRKLEIIRTLYRDGYQSLIPTDDKALIESLVEARKRHERLSQELKSKILL